MAATEITGEIGQCNTPDWEPLKRHLCGPYMWMGEIVLADGTRLQAYKHRMTRHYLHLDPEGDNYLYCQGGRYQREPLDPL